MEKLEQCPICNTKENVHFLECEDFTVSHKTFTIVACKNCNFRYTNPRPSEKEIGPYYKSESYISHSNSGKGLINSVYKQVRKYTLAQKFKLVSDLSKGNSILDYGSGAGFFLDYCKQKKWITKGVEADKETRERVIKEFGLDLISPQQINTLNEKEFDVITLWHVLEHIYKLKETLSTLVKSLKKDGILFIAVPNCASYDAKHYGKYWAAYDLPRHIYHFRPNDISNLFTEFNMKVIQTLPMVFDSFYVSMLSEKYKNNSLGTINGVINGLQSNLKGNPSNSFSSQIYILKKN